MLLGSERGETARERAAGVNDRDHNGETHVQDDGDRHLSPAAGNASPPTRRPVRAGEPAGGHSRESAARTAPTAISAGAPGPSATLTGTRSAGCSGIGRFHTRPFRVASMSGSG